MVLVRPELGADGKRRVTVEAQAARLQALEALRLPEVEQAGATITVPRHFPVQRRQARSRSADGESLLLTLPSPEGSGRVILVSVRVRRIRVTREPGAATGTGAARRTRSGGSTPRSRRAGSVRRSGRRAWSAARARGR